MQSTSSNNNHLVSLLLIGLLFSIFGFVTWLNGALIKFLQTACELNHQQASLVTFAFFISYFVMAIPSSGILRRTGFKRGMSIGLLTMAAGCLLFLPAAWQRSYPLFLIGLFTQGLGLAILQTASNPYVTIIGPLDSAARRISLMGICNKLAGALGAILLARLLLTPLDELQEHIIAATDLATKNQLLDTLTQQIILPYSIMSGFLVLVAIGIRRSPLPDLKDDSTAKASHDVPARSLSSHVYLFLGALAIFAYVGVEVIAGDYIIQYGTYLGQETGDETLKLFANYLTSVTLIFMLAGYGIGVLLIPRVISQEQALRINVLCSLALTGVILFTTGKVSVFSLAFLGFFHAVMWPAIWPMSIKGLGKHTKIGSALLVMGIAGGAVIPWFLGMLTDAYQGDMKAALWIMIPCYLYILFFAVKGHRIGAAE